jgi:hypothetical protein
VEQLRTSETNMKNLFYREQEARQVLELDYKELAFECDKHMELRIASDRDLVNFYKSLQKLNEDCEVLRAQLKELEEAANCTDEQYAELLEQMAPIAEQVAEKLNLQ